MDVRMPDGTIITNVPDNITQSELLARYNRMQGVDTGTKNPLMGALGRAAGLTAAGVEAVAEVAERAGDYMESKIPLSNIPPEQIKSQKQLQPLFDLAGSLRNVEKNIGYTPSTKLSELADNPLNAVPFIAERVITSTPDMAAAVFALGPYIGARTKEILDERVKNDNKTLDDATVGDVTAAVGAAVTEATLERFATKRLGKGAEAQTRTGRLAKETGVQGGTEAIEESAAYLGETAGTVKGVDPMELGERALEGAIVGGGLGGGVQATREVLGGKKEAPPPEKEEELKQLAEDSAKERLVREQIIEQQEAEQAATTAPEDLALAAFGETPEQAARRQREEVVKPLEKEPVTELRREEPIRPREVAPEIPAEAVPPKATEPVFEPEERFPEPEEVVRLRRQGKELEDRLKEVEREAEKTRTSSLYEFFAYRPRKPKEGQAAAPVADNRLDMKEVFDLSPDKDFNFIRKKGGARVSDFVSSQQLNDWLPFELRIYGTETADELSEKESAAEEYIKNALRDRNYLPYETQLQLEQLNTSLQKIDDAIAKEMTDEQLREEINSIAAEIAIESGPVPSETAPEIVTAPSVAERPATEGEAEEVRFRQVIPKDEIQTKVVYRAGPTELGSMPKGMTAQDILDYEQIELGNKGVKAVSNIDLKSIPANSLSWVTFDKKAAQQYVDMEAPKEFRNEITKRKATFRIIAKDNYGGYLIQEVSERPELELEAETAEETVARQEREASELEKKELKKIADLERDLFKLEQESSPVTPPVQQRLFDINNATPAPLVQDGEITPSFTREFDRLSKLLDNDKIDADEFAARVQMARRSALAAKEAKPIPERVRGSDFIIEKLRNGVRRGMVSREAVDLAEWFIKQNPQLVKDLGISIRNSEADGEAGSYLPVPRIVRLIAGSTKSDTAIHEILHHLERMMPEKVRNDIATSWLKQYADAKKAAAGDDNLTKYFELLDKHHSTGKTAPFEEALNLIKNGQVDYQNYQFANPSEFWAVNASRIVKGQYDVRGDRLGALKRWLSELVQALKKILGMKSDAPIIKALDSLSKADGKFVSTEMLAGTGVYPNIRTNIFGKAPINAAWGRPDDSKIDDYRVVLQDKMLDTKRVVEQIEKAQGKLKDRWNAYLQEELYHGRTAKQTNDFLEDELTPLIKEIKNAGFTIDEVDEYLHNRHAEERNTQVAKINPEMPDGGSGIKTEDARRYLASLDPDSRKKFESIAQKIDAITAKTRKILVSQKVEDPATIEAWEKAYKNYVPLFRAEQDYELPSMGMAVGRGFAVRGPSSRRALGSSRPVVDILANIANQRERAIIRSEKNRVTQAVYGMAVQHPNPDFWLAVDPDAVTDIDKVQNDLKSIGIPAELAENLFPEPTKKAILPSGQVGRRINDALRKSNFVLPVRINGREKYVFFNQNDPRAVRMVEALQNLDADQLGRAMSMVARVTRYFAAVNTQYNPIFGVINFMRDVQGAALNLTTTPIRGMTKQVMADTMPALRGIYADVRARRKGEKLPDNKWAKLWEEFQQEGGQTGFRDQFSTSEQRAEALNQILNPDSWADSKLGKIFTANGALKVPLETARTSVAKPIFDWLSDYNQTMENAVRLAAYKAALDKGMTKEQAASVAKNLTVNFNRKGQIARQAGALYAFFNASVQGTTRLIQTIRGPAGKTIVFGGLVLGSIQALTLWAAGFDEDEPPDFIKERNLIIPIGGKKYISIPMPLGYNVIPNTSRIFTEWILSGGKDTSKRVAQLTGAFLEAFNPVGNSGWSLQTFTPTVLDPGAALFENKDWTGKPIAKEDLSSLDPTPGYTRAKDTATTFSKYLAEFLNYASGGTQYKPGVFSPTPDQIDYLIGQITGGVGREAMKFEQTITSAVTGEELPTYKIPLFGRLFGTAQDQAAQRDRFYNNIIELNKHENEIKGRRKNRQPVDEYLRENPEARLFGYANTVERQIQNLRRRREQLIEKGAPKEQVQAVEKRITDVMTQFNERVRRAKGD